MTSARNRLRGQISAAPRNKRGYGRYSDELRRAVVRYTKGRAADGEAVTAIAGELGMNQRTLWMWTRGESGKNGGGKEVVRAVKLVGARATPDAATTSGPVIVLPSDARIRG